MTKNYFYTDVVTDSALSAELDTALKDTPLLKTIQGYDSEVPETGKKILAWATYATLNSVEPFVKKEVTKNSHAEGRSVASSGSEPVVPEVPEEKFYMRPNGDKYFHRPWGVDKNDVEILRAALLHMHFPLLYGPPGTGKTAMVEAAFGADLITILGTGDTELSDLVGGYIQDESGKFIWVDGPLLRAAEEGKPLLIDEIGIIDPKVLTVVYGLMDGRREYTVTANPARGTVKAADGFFVIGATNPNAPGVRLSEALLSRFTLHVEVLTNYDMALDMGVDRNIVSVAKSLDHMVLVGEAEWAPQMRELLAFRDVSKVYGKRFAIENLLASAPENSRQEIINIIKKGPMGSGFQAAKIK
jgi:nitric oxide reductase NorQ protein